MVLVSMDSQWSSTIKLPWVRIVTGWYLSWYDLRCFQDIKFQQPTTKSVRPFSTLNNPLAYNTVDPIRPCHLQIVYVTGLTRQEFELRTFAGGSLRSTDSATAAGVVKRMWLNRMLIPLGGIKLLFQTISLTKWNALEYHLVELFYWIEMTSA